ncbi:MAG: citramalate synthase [Magnetococcales bacterium]|nr:citramalate synthase [Magnetococcales bacterium]
MLEIVSAADSNFITIYDTTLRDGSQGEDILFSVEDKLRITRRLDELGVPFIEGGWPGANPKDDAYFREVRKLSLKNSRVSAFSSTQRAGVAVDKDKVLQGLLKAETGVVTIFGKSWDLHVTDALNISLEENLELIYNSIRYLKSRVDTVFYDAEHFFDGHRANPEYAIKTLLAARDGGADALVLCETNGGRLVDEVTKSTQEALKLGVEIGIHTHNDSGLAVANTLAAVGVGATHIQGTINGVGERCGNSDLTTVIPNIILKMGKKCDIWPKQLTSLTSVSRFVDEMLNRSPRENQPFVGNSAFAHKGGIHVSAVRKNSETYEHIRPQLVGNRQRVLVSEQAGKSNLLAKLSEFGITNLDSHDSRLQTLLSDVKDLESRGYQFDGADASFELRARRALGDVPEFFKLHGFRVIDERRQRNGDGPVVGAEATVKLEVASKIVHLVWEGSGPVDSLHGALCQALEWYYPTINDVKLVDFKVRILSGVGTSARVRVLIEWQDGERRWGTVGVSEHIIAASYDAMVESLNYKLFIDGATPVK